MKRLKKAFALIPPSLLVMAVLMSEHRKYDSHTGLMQSKTEGRAIPSVVFATSLRDTLPVEMVERFGLSKVSGVKLKSGPRNDVSYFEYSAEVPAFLRALGNCPFHRSEILADTTARRIDRREIEMLAATVNETEKQAAPLFWNSGKSFDAYECIKPPFRHTLLVNTSTGKILHRVSFS